MVDAWLVTIRQVSDEVEPDLEDVRMPEPVRVRVPVPAGGAVGAVLGAGKRLCADCRSRRRADSMLQCRACLAA
jgi:hypothetical protein